MKTTDPAAMTEAERFDELAELLARGVQRFFAARCKAPTPTRNSQDHLDVVAHAEAPCGPRVQSPQSRTPA